jgi:hypothetical protein
MMFWPRLSRPAGFPVGAVSVNLDEGPGLVATQTLMFLFAEIEVSAAIMQRLADARARGGGRQSRLIRAGLAAHGG